MAELNVFDKPLIACYTSPATGCFRDGFCRTIQEGSGTQVVCAIVTDEFLDYTAKRGNDLRTPIPYRNFSGLIAGSKWCLCISRWLEAERAGVEPSIDLNAKHIKALDYTSLNLLQLYAQEY